MFKPYPIQQRLSRRPEPTRRASLPFPPHVNWTGSVAGGARTGPRCRARVCARAAQGRTPPAAAAKTRPDPPCCRGSGPAVLPEKLAGSRADADGAGQPAGVRRAHRGHLLRYRAGPGWPAVAVRVRGGGGPAGRGPGAAGVPVLLPGRHRALPGAARPPRGDPRPPPRARVECMRARVRVDSACGRVFASVLAPALLRKTSTPPAVVLAHARPPARPHARTRILTRTRCRRCWSSTRWTTTRPAAAARHARAPRVHAQTSRARTHTVHFARTRSCTQALTNVAWRTWRQGDGSWLVTMPRREGGGKKRQRAGGMGGWARRGGGCLVTAWEDAVRWGGGHWVFIS